MNHIQSDVIIIGGGHVGLYAASQLAKQGFSVTLLEKKKAIGERIVCTGIIGKEAFEKYDLPEETIVGCIQNVRFFSPFGNFFDFDPPKPLAQIVNRTQFNRVFENNALKAGASVHAHQNVQKVKVKNEGVSVFAIDKDQNEFHFEAALLLLATGVNTRLFQSAGIRPPNQFLRGAQLHIAYDKEDRTLIFSGNEISPGAFGWLVPVRTGFARVGLLCEKNPGLYLRRILDRVKPGWRDDTPESQIDMRPVIQGPIDKSYAHRVLVLGEAAGQIKTTTGGGIYYGMLGVDVAVGVIRQAFLKNRFKADILSSYDKEWKKLMAEELRMGYYCRKIYAKFSDEQIEALFEKAAQKDLLELARTSANFDWHQGLLGTLSRHPTFQRMFANLF